MRRTERLPAPGPGGGGRRGPGGPGLKGCSSHIVPVPAELGQTHKEAPAPGWCGSPHNQDRRIRRPLAPGWCGPRLSSWAVVCDKSEGSGCIQTQGLCYIPLVGNSRSPTGQSSERRPQAAPGARTCRAVHQGEFAVYMELKSVPCLFSCQFGSPSWEGAVAGLEWEFPGKSGGPRGPLETGWGAQPWPWLSPSNAQLLSHTFWAKTFSLPSLSVTSLLQHPTRVSRTAPGQGLQRQGLGERPSIKVASQTRGSAPATPKEGPPLGTKWADSAGVRWASR